MVDLTREDYKEAVKRGQELARQPRAVSACFDVQRNRVIVRLTTGIEIGFAPQDAEGLENASTDQLASVTVRENGLGLHFPLLDADLYVPALLDGVLGSAKWMAQNAMTETLGKESWLRIGYIISVSEYARQRQTPSR